MCGPAAAAVITQCVWQQEGSEVCSGSGGAGGAGMWTHQRTGERSDTSHFASKCQHTPSFCTMCVFLFFNTPLQNPQSLLGSLQLKDQSIVGMTHCGWECWHVDTPTDG
jgi:hypothetical protein